MVLIVFAIEAFLYHVVFSTYLGVTRGAETLGIKLLGFLVLGSYTALVCTLLRQHLDAESSNNVLASRRSIGSVQVMAGQRMPVMETISHEVHTAYPRHDAVRRNVAFMITMLRLGN